MKSSKASGESASKSAAELISKRIAELGDWRGETLSRMRKLIAEAEPNVVEEWKWMGTPVFSRDGIICTGESYKKVVKLTFAKGAALKDPAKLFNSSMDGNVRRAIDIAEGEKIDEGAFKALVREAVALNALKPAKKAKSAAEPSAKPSAAKSVKPARPAKSAPKTAKPAKPTPKSAKSAPKTAKSAPKTAKSAKPTPKSAKKSKP